MKPTIPMQTFELPSHCIVTLAVGTNYTDELHRSAVQTKFSLRFEGAYPLQIKGLKEKDEFVGFELTLTGTDELEQLTTSLEMAAAELRKQVNAQSTSVAQPPTLEEYLSRPANTCRVVLDPVPAAEVMVLESLAIYGKHLLPTGEPVAYHLLNRLAEQPLATQGCAELWQLCQRARAANEVPDLSWLQAHSGPESQEVLEQLRTGLGFLKLSPNWGNRISKTNVQMVCDYAITNLALAHLRKEQDQVIDKLTTVQEDELQFELLGQIQNLNKQVRTLSEQLGRHVS